MPDYSKGKIYILRNTVNGVVYVGSTCQTLSQRFNNHKADSKRNHNKLHEGMKEVGIDKFYIELLEDFPCERREQLDARENFHMRQYAITYNTLAAYRSEEQRLEYQKQWTAQNFAKVKEQKNRSYLKIKANRQTTND